MVLSALLAVGQASRPVAGDADALARTVQLDSEGRLVEATEALQTALAIREQTEPMDARALARTLNDLGVAYRLQNRLEDAARLYGRALQILRTQARGGEHDRLMAAVLHNLGRVQEAQGRRKSAEQLLRESIREREECCGSDDPDLAASLESLAGILQSRGRLDDAERLLQRANEIERHNFPPGHVRIALGMNAMAALEAARKHYANAEQLLRSAVEIVEHSEPLNDPVLGETLGNLATSYWLEHKLEESEQAYQRATEILMRTWGPSDGRLVAWMERYAAVLRARQDFAEAERVEMRAMKIRVTSALRAPAER